MAKKLSLHKTLARHKSRTEPGVVHYVTMHRETGVVTCGCKGFTYRGKCRHVESALDRLVHRGYAL